MDIERGNTLTCGLYKDKPSGSSYMTAPRPLAGEIESMRALAVSTTNEQSNRK